MMLAGRTLDAEIDDVAETIIFNLAHGFLCIVDLDAFGLGASA
ncbi:MAG: hypothetical protein WDN48_06245 [Pseudolabrys sp.]